MSARVLRPENVGAAALVLGGIGMIAFPQHLPTAVRLVVVTAAAAAAVYALARHVPPSGWLSPYRWMSPFRSPVRPRDARPVSDDLTRLRARLSGRRQRVEGAPALPPEILRLLRDVLAEADEVGGSRGPGSSPDLVGPWSRAVLETEPLETSSWLRTRRGHAHQVAEVVHRVLDDAARLGLDTHDPRPSPVPIRPSSP